MKKIIVLLIIFLSSCSSEKEAAVDNTPKLLPTVKTKEVTTIAVSSAKIICEVVSDGGKPITTYGVCWSLTGNPDINSNRVDISNQGGPVSGFICDLTSLQETTTYNVRAYATNTDGTSYGNMLTFKTLAQVYFTTKEITDVAATSASTFLPELTGIVTNPNAYSKGICYGVTNNPTITNDLLTKHSGDLYVFKNLLPNTTYYVRAYYTNTLTNEVTYGQNRMFTTLAAGTSPQGPIAICDGIQITTLVPVTSPSGRIWMDRNLGASKVLVPGDQLGWSGSIGGYYQWGRGNDGHASILSETINVTSNSDTPGHDQRISGPGEGMQYYYGSGSGYLGPVQGSKDWRVPKNDNLWQGVNGINNPCPAGYRIPTKEEFEIEFAANNITNYESGINSPLRIIIHNGVNYWTSTKNLLPAPSVTVPNVFGSYYILLNAGNNTIEIKNADRHWGLCVRCIKD